MGAGHGQVQRIEEKIRNHLEKPLKAAKKKISEEVRRKSFTSEIVEDLQRRKKENLVEQVRICPTGLRL